MTTDIEILKSSDNALPCELSLWNWDFFIFADYIVEIQLNVFPILPVVNVPWSEVEDNRYSLAT